MYLTIVKKTKIFLKLIQNYNDDITLDLPKYKKRYYNNSITFSTFYKQYVTLLNSIYIFEYVKCKITFTRGVSNTFLYKIFYFYAKLSTTHKQNKLQNLGDNLFHTYIFNNVLVFTKPKKQLFLIFFKKKPIFIFTGGLMRKVMNEKRKSNKKLYKVAVSLVKLSAILLLKKNYFSSCYLKLKNIGQLRNKVLTVLLKNNVYKNINYVIIDMKRDLSAQKFKTRGSIKKYVKKRFKLNN